ncbi:MAG: hypothetical protein IJX71_04325 [Oscillospiraceae bacterium]|nr:hypothetical protein [Oscillospiraceae bacterium]
MGSNYRPEEGYMPPDTSKLDASPNWPPAEEDPAPGKHKLSGPLVLSVLLCIGLLIGFIAFSVYYQNEISYLEQQLSNARNTVSTLQAENAQLQDAADFLDNYIVIISDDGSNLYHRYGCDDLDTSSFWAYNIHAATDDYDPCPVCYPDAAD